MQLKKEAIFIFLVQRPFFVMRQLVFYCGLVMAMMGPAFVHAEPQELSELEGVWFTCEFAKRTSPPEDNCVMFDDEGFLVEQGRVAYLRNLLSDESACKGNKKGQCFKAATASITVSRRPIGPVHAQENQLLVRFMGCTQRFDLQQEKHYFSVTPAENKCYWATKRHFYVARYKGKVIFE